MQLLSQSAQLLDVVARAGSFRQAAEQLNRSASAINRQVLKLEEEAGLPLFERLPRGVRPTAAGERVLADIRRWSREQRLIEGQLRDLQGQRRGAVTVGAMECFSTALLPQAIKEMSERNPLVEIDVQIDRADGIYAKIVGKDIDFALFFNPPERVVGEALHVWRARPGLVMAPNHPLARAADLRLSECLQYSFVRPSASLGIRRVIDRAFEEMGVGIPGMISTDSTALMKSMLKLGSQLAILSVFDVQAELMRGELAFVPVADRDFGEEVLCIAAPANRHVSPAARDFIEIIRAGFDGLHDRGLVDKGTAQRRGAGI